MKSKLIGSPFRVQGSKVVFTCERLQCIVMQNHLHGIITIVGALFIAPFGSKNGNP